VLLGAPLALEVDGQQVRAAGEQEQMILPRNSVLPMKLAMEAKMRLEVPESPPWLRSPRKASASSMTTATGHIALSRLKIFSRLPSVTPCHWLRKLRNFTQGTPMSPAKQVVMKVLPVPTGPPMR
jgi:hypothetical protein